MIDRNIRRHFDNLQQPWRKCYICDPIYYPESELIKADEDKQWYCYPCYRFKFYKAKLDEQKIRLKDDIWG